MVDFNVAEGYVEIRREPVVLDIGDFVETIRMAIVDYLEHESDEELPQEDFFKVANFILEKAKYPDD